MESSTVIEGGRRHYKASTILIIFFISIGSLAYGYAASIISTTIGQPSFLAYMGLDTATNAAQLIGATNALFYGGGFIGACISGKIVDAWGRKMGIVIASTLILISGALLAGSVNIAMFIVFRLLGGIGAAMIQVSVPLYITELVPPKGRGMLADIHTIMINLGYMIASYVGVGFYFYTGSGNDIWRAPIAIQCLPCIIVLIGIWWMPESPRYLLTKNRTEEAWAIVRNLHSNPKDLDDDFARREFFQMRKQMEIDRELKSSYWEMLRRPSYRKRVFMTVGLIFVIFSSGALVINSYGTILYKGLGYDTTQQLLFQAGWLAVSLACNVMALLFVERFPRPTLICIGLVGMIASVTCFTALSATYLETTNVHGLAGAVAMTFTADFFYGGFLDGPSYFYLAEIYPTHLRAQGMTFGIATLNIMSIIWLTPAPTAFNSIGWKYYLFFIIIPVIGGPIIYLLFPNTKNKALEEIAELFGDNDLVAVYQKDIHVDGTTHEVTAARETIVEKHGKSIHQEEN